MELLMSKKNIKKPNYRKISEKIKKLGNPNEATNSQLERLFNLQHIKYVMTLEDQLKEDKAHLLLKQNTIETLEDHLKEDSSTHYPSDMETKNIIQSFEADEKKREGEIKEKNLKIEELQNLYDEAIEINKDVIVKNRNCIKANQEILKDHHEITRAYNGLAEMGKFAGETGVDIKKHNGKLPENHKWDFEQKHTLTEGGKVKHHYKLKAKKENK